MHHNDIHSQVEQTCSAGRTNRSPGCFPLSSCRGTGNEHSKTEYFFLQFCRRAIEAENQDRTHVEVKTSYTEDVGDAWALKADEGRGDRRNVQGELHASDEP